MKIGLTGRIACGKSSVSKILAEKGFDILDGDKVVHEVLTYSQVKMRIFEKFGEGVFNENGSIDRVALGAIVFADETQKTVLENIVRPSFYEAMKWGARKSGNQVIDYFKLIGTELELLVTEVWEVRVTPEIQLERLMKRNRFTEKQALERIAAQQDIFGAHFVIDNSGTLENTRAQVESRLKILFS